MASRSPIMDRLYYKVRTMLFVPASQLTEGMCVAEDVKDGRGRVLIARGQRITSDHIDRLEKFGIHSLFVQSSEDENPWKPPKSDLRKKCEAVLTAAGPRHAKEAAKPAEPTMQAVREAADSLVTSLMSARRTVLTLSGGSPTDDLLTQHSVNAAALAVAIAIDFRLSQDTLIDIGSAMLLHDVGLRLLPPEIFAYGSPPDEDAIRLIRTHPQVGYEYVLESGALTPMGAEIVRSHHERLDGSGYPAGLHRSQLTLPVKIAAVAEAYDSLISDRLGIPAALPDAALAWMLRGAGTLFDRQTVLALSNRVALYPNGSSVRLTTGETGTVAGTLPKSPRRPVVLIDTDHTGRKLAAPMIVDLTLETDRAVARCARTRALLEQSRASRMPTSYIEPNLACLG